MYSQWPYDKLLTITSIINDELKDAPKPIERTQAESYATIIPSTKNMDSKQNQCTLTDVKNYTFIWLQSKPYKSISENSHVNTLYTLKTQDDNNLHVQFDMADCFIPSINQSIPCVRIFTLILPKYLQNQGLGSFILKQLEMFAALNQRGVLIMYVNNPIMIHILKKRNYNKRFIMDYVWYAPDLAPRPYRLIKTVRDRNLQLMVS